MTASIRFIPGQRWTFDGMNLRFERELGGEVLHFLVERTLAPLQVDALDGSREAPDRAWAREAFAQGRLRQLPTLAECGQSQARELAAAQHHSPEEVAERDPQAALRHFVLNGFDRMGQFGLGRAAISRGLEKLWAENAEKARPFGAPPPVSSVRRWMVTRGIPGERPMCLMVSMRGRVGRPKRLPHPVHKLLLTWAIWYWANPRMSIADAFAKMSSRLIRLNRWRERAAVDLPHFKLPSRETFRKKVRSFECYETYAAKWGEKRAKARFKGAGRGLRAQRFLELGCMDHTMLDAIAIDVDMMLPIGRPWLTILIDVHTRCIVGFVISYGNPSLHEVTECLKRANRPKPHLLVRQPEFPVLADIYGRFDEIVVDNGWELSGTSFEDLMADMGTSVRWAPVASPTYKAVVERFFGILNHILNSKLPGGTLRPELMRELGYDPSKDAVLTVEELEDLIWQAISYYHIEEHSSLRRPPADLWKHDSEAYGIPVISDDRQLDRMLGALKQGAKLSRSGVTLFGLQYHDPFTTEGLLEDLIASEPVRAGRKGSATATVKIKYNPANIAEVHVWNQRRNQYVTLPCADDRYAEGFSLWQHDKLREWSKQKGLEFSSQEQRLLARAALITEIQKSGPALTAKQRRAAARLKQSPKIAALNGAGVVMAHAPARHDGMAPIIEHEPLATSRIDGDLPPSRPARPGGQKSKAKPQRRIQKLTALPSEIPEEADEFEITTRWEGFSL